MRVQVTELAINAFSEACATGSSSLQHNLWVASYQHCLGHLLWPTQHSRATACCTCQCRQQTWHAKGRGHDCSAKESTAGTAFVPPSMLQQQHCCAPSTGHATTTVI